MQTIRQQIVEKISEEALNALELSKLLRIREKDVCEHLDHIRRSQSAIGRKLIVIPARCLECGYEFESRGKPAKPGRCPRCRNEHIQDPRYRIVDERSKLAKIAEDG